MTKRIFIDAHCHFFNLDDVPIYPTIMGEIPVNTFLFLGLSIRQVAVKTLQHFKPFIQFFERSRCGNLQMYSKDIWKCASKAHYDEVILIPLIMDFSVMKDSVEKVSDQLVELLAAIQRADEILSANNTRVLPFFGIDMRNFKDCQTKEAVKTKISTLSVGLFDFEKKKSVASKTGTLVGFKLYPSIGYSPFPDDITTRSRYFHFYNVCVENSIPLTVHCQSIKSGAFKSTDQDKETLNGYINPMNWVQVLSHADKLKINFAHFGGDSVLRDTFLNQQAYPKKRPSETWTWEIVKMLKSFENTYADVSAFDFSKQSLLDAFGTMIILDENGFYDEFIQESHNKIHRLSDKILWGSDWPMVIDNWQNNYQSMFDRFRKSLNFRKILKEKIKPSVYFRKVFDQIVLPDSINVFDKIVSNNPKKFLFS